MNRRAKLTLILIFFASCFGLGDQAMTIDDFGRLNDDDEAGYVAFLVEASAQLLKSQGQPDQARQVVLFFKESGPHGGVPELASNLKTINTLNKRNETNPNNRVPEYQVEDAMARTLKSAGFNIPVRYLLTAGKNFHPDGPPRQHILGNG